ncbi:MAG: hypothetical protein LBD86_00905 [Spirochaetaceae bacterium]|jgi:hypothetical protein|nr:hypothetical protein [Spirochaetaceae bacterium]
MRNYNLGILAALVLSLAFAACATTGENYAELAAQGLDVFAGKNWNAPRRNNMYDRWEFGNDGTFHFWHVHHGEALDRGVYRYEVKDGALTATKEGSGETASYTYTFSGKTFTLRPRHHSEKHEAGEHVAAEHAPSGGHRMGALPENPVTFTRAR